MRSTGERPHTSLANALDVVVLFSVAAAIVLFLGSRHRFSIGPLRVTMPDAERLLIFAVLAAILRYWIGSGLPILSSLPVQNFRAKLEAERERFAHPPPATPDVKYYAVAAVMASLLWLTPHIANIRHVPDAGDPIFYAWQLARFAHQLLNEPTRLFDGNIFHPAPDTLLYADPMVLEGFVALPFIAAGVDPLVVSNTLLLASFPLCALAFFYAGWRLTTDPRAGCIAGILGGLSTFKIEHYSHLELQFVCFAPLAIVTLMRLVAAPSWRTGALFGAVVTAQWLACMYLGVMLFVFLAPFVLFVTVAWGVRPTRQLAIAAATACAIVLIGGSITAIPFLRSHEDRGERPLQLVDSYSALPSDYVASHDRLVTYRGILPRSRNKSERELFPGSLPLMLASVGAVPPMSLGAMALVAGTVVAFEGSLGTNGLIYDDLHRYLLPFRGLRVAARFAAFVGAGLILLSAYGARRVFLLGRTRATQGVLFALVAAGALIDLRFKVPLEPYYATVPPIYSRVTPDMVLAELPMRLIPNSAYMYFSTFHWARLVNGHSAYWPDGYWDLQRVMEHFPQTNLLQWLRDRGTTHITVNCRLFSEPWRCAPLLEIMDGLPELERISTTRWEGFEVRLYRLR